MSSNKYNSIVLRDDDSFARRIGFALKWIVPAFFVSLLIPYCSGYPGVGNTLITFLSLSLARFNRIAFFLVCFLLLTVALYIPVGYDFGRINFAFVVSGMQTNADEAIEFFNDISFAALLLCASSLAFLYLYTRGEKYYGSKYSLLVLCIFLVINLNAYPVRMLKSVCTYTQKAGEEFERLNQLSKTVDDFTVTGVSPQYKNIVVIIGESVTRDYMSLYGYSKNTTPWLNNASGYFFSEYISAAPNTYLSLPRTLAMSDGVKVDDGNNIVSLSKKAGFETYWVSNQGYLGAYDTPSTMIASKAQHTKFLKKGDYNSSNVDDFAMLTELKEIFAEKSQKQNAIYLHMIGSHPDTCSRLNGYPVNFDVGNEKLNCYLATIQKLDAFIKETVKTLNDTREPYVLFYFSDHGMTLDKSDRPVRHGNDARQNYNVPFFVITSDAKEHVVNSNKMSARDFIALYERYVGFSSNKVAPKDLDASQSQGINVFNGEKLIPYEQLKTNNIVY
jgi:glucan phosphoethanolaminetransferase (alkaline phosphatase superfamily)